MKKLLGVLAVLLLLAGSSAAELTQPPIHDIQTQLNPQNSRVVASGSNTATVTVSGVTGQRVRVYFVAVQCIDTPTNLIPSLVLSDGTGAVLFQTSSITMSNITNPVGEHRWLPGLAFSVGSTVTIVGNTGGACTGGTIVHVQADQY